MSGSDPDNEGSPIAGDEGGVTLGKLGRYATAIPTDLRIATEYGRQRLFQFLLALLMFELLGLFVLVASTSITVPEALEFWGAIGPPVTGLLGLATSHYFHHDQLSTSHARSVELI